MKIPGCLKGAEKPAGFSRKRIWLEVLWIVTCSFSFSLFLSLFLFSFFLAICHFLHALQNGTNQQCLMLGTRYVFSPIQWVK